MRWKNVFISILGGMAIVGSCFIGSLEAQSTTKLRNKPAGQTREQAMFEILKDRMFLDGAMTNSRIEGSGIGSNTAAPGKFTTLETATLETTSDAKIGTDTQATTSVGGITIGEGTEATAVIDSIFIGCEETDGGTSTLSIVSEVGTTTNTGTIDSSIRIRVNGADYLLLLDKI